MADRSAEAEVVCPATSDTFGMLPESSSGDLPLRTPPKAINWLPAYLSTQSNHLAYKRDIILAGAEVGLSKHQLTAARKKLDLTLYRVGEGLYAPSLWGLVDQPHIRLGDDIARRWLPKSKTPRTKVVKPPVTFDNPLYAAAILYAREGMKVLPIMPRGKNPIITLVPHAVHSATTDEVLITQWWTEVPDANVGIALVDEFFAIDGDRHHPGDNGPGDWLRLMQRYGISGETRIAITGNDGVHYLYRHAPGHSTTGKTRGTILEGYGAIDYLSGGRYIVVAPSIHPDTGRQYRWGNTNDIAVMDEAFYQKVPTTVVVRGKPRKSKPKTTKPKTKTTKYDDEVLDRARKLKDQYTIDPDAALTERFTEWMTLRAEGDQSLLVMRMVRSAVQKQFDLTKLYRLLMDPANPGGMRLRRMMSGDEAGGFSWLDSLIEAAFKHQAQALVDLDDLEPEWLSHRFRKTEVFLDRRGSDESIKREKLEAGIRGALQIARTAHTTSPMISQDHFAEVTGMSRHTCRKVLMAGEWLGFWTPEATDHSGNLYHFILDPESRETPPLSVAPGKVLCRTAATPIELEMDSIQEAFAQWLKDPTTMPSDPMPEELQDRLDRVLHGSVTVDSLVDTQSITTVG